MMRVFVHGKGKSGTAAQRVLGREGHRIVDEPPCDLYVPSPGVPPHDPLYREMVERGVPIKGEMELAFERMRGEFIGVTGTNGKTTLVEMLSHLLGCPALGNIGTPVCDALPIDRAVIEISSYQLETLRTPKLTKGVLLNVAEDHLDWHGSFEAYRGAKLRIQDLIVPGGTLYVAEKLMRYVERPCIVLEEGMRLEEIALLVAGRGSLKGFERPAHRLEYLGKRRGIHIYNDSKATNVAATQFALSQMKEPPILLLGGQDKGLDFSSISGAKCILAFGQAGEKIAHQLGCECFDSLEGAVDRAFSIAVEGDTLLLSPGCASFDAFENYILRGEMFDKLTRM